MTTDETNSHKFPRPDESEINFPWFIYPGAPFCGYVSSEFLPELHRLCSFITMLRDKVRSPTLLHLTIGSPMEECGILRMQKMGTTFQMYQLVPAHLFEIAKTDTPVVNIVICPNHIDVPMFMALTSDFEKLSNTVYVHKKYPIHVHIFRTMMPTDDKVRNARAMDMFREKNFQEVFHEGVEMYRQTAADCKFVSQFYAELECTMKHVKRNGGDNTCFSFAVFNADTDRSRFNNFVMFKEVLFLYQGTGSLICEWVFRYGAYTVHESTRSVSQLQRSIGFVPLDVLMTFDSIPKCFYITPTPSSHGLSLNFEQIDELSIHNEPTNRETDEAGERPSTTDKKGSLYTLDQFGKTEYDSVSTNSKSHSETVLKRSVTYRMLCARNNLSGRYDLCKKYINPPQDLSQYTASSASLVRSTRSPRTHITSEKTSTYGDEDYASNDRVDID